ncbi:MAG TPA: hypothetical protein ENN42_09060 [Thioalkalivibrio sp.]|nr:hypothetical protein [Thioalkalivibrio sp.]
MPIDNRAAWEKILENHTRGASAPEEREEKLARFAAREEARAEHLTNLLGDVVAVIDSNLGKDAEIDEFLGNIKTFVLQGVNQANQVGFKAQRAPASENDA